MFTVQWSTWKSDSVFIQSKDYLAFSRNLCWWSTHFIVFNEGIYRHATGICRNQISLNLLIRPGLILLFQLFKKIHFCVVWQFQMFEVNVLIVWVLGEPSNLIFGFVWDFVPTANPNFFKPKPQPYKRVILLQYGRGSPVPTQKSPKHGTFSWKNDMLRKA